MNRKFDDCVDCRFRKRPVYCRDCDVGELFEDNDAPGVDDAMRDVPTRFGESVTDDVADEDQDEDQNDE